MTEEHAFEAWAKEKARLECSTQIFLEPIPVLQRKGPRVSVVGYTGNLRAVLNVGRHGGEPPILARHHSSLQVHFKIAQPDADHRIFDDAGTDPASAATASVAFMNWLRSVDALQSLTLSWEKAGAPGL